MVRRFSRAKRKQSTKKHVSFVTADGKRVTFKSKSKKRKGKTPTHLKPYTNRMKELSTRRKNGEFGNMSWKSIVSKHMSNKPKRKSTRKVKRKSTKPRRRTSRKSFFKF